jgi:hypothetical protein
MGTHSKPKAGYLPKVAAGAAPFALLIAGPATAWADQPSLPVPIDHQHSGSFDKDLRVDSTDIASGTSSVLTGFATAANNDIYTGRFGDQVVQGLDRSTHHLETANTALTTLPLNPAQGQIGPSSQDGHRLAVSDSRYDAIRLPGGVDAIGEFVNSPQLGLARTTALTSNDGNLHAVSGLAGNVGLTHTDGYAVDLGDLASFGTSSEQDGSGSFTGLLDVARGADGLLTSTVSDGADVAAHQSHAVGGHLGPLSADTSTSQSADSGYRGSIKGLVWPNAKSVGGFTRGGELSLDTSETQSLGLDHVFHIDAGLATSASTAGGVTEVAKNGVPAAPATTQNSRISQDGHLSVRLFDQAPVGGGLKITAPPLQIQPQH